MVAFPAASTCTRSKCAPQRWLGSSFLHPVYRHLTFFLICPQFTSLPEPSLISHSRVSSACSQGAHMDCKAKNWERATASGLPTAGKRVPAEESREGGNLRPWQTSGKLQVSEEGDGITQESSSGRQQASHPPLCARHGSAEPDTELGSLSAFQICRMITSVSEFTALIPPT